jgi:outer membrane protein assembly factor BamA
VEIRGLRRTQSVVVFRELSARSGQPLDWNSLERDRLRLLDLGLFAAVDFVPRRDRGLDRPVLEVRVLERPVFLAAPTLSWDQGHGFTYGASATTLNLGGMARQVWVSGGAGARPFGEAGYASRWAFGHRLGLSMTGSLLRERNLPQRTIESHAGGNLWLSPARGPHISFPVGTGWEEVRTKPDPHPAAGPPDSVVRRRYDHRWVEVGARIDTRDYRARPRRGEVLAVRAAAHGGLLGGTSALERYALDAMLVRPTGGAILTIASRTILSRGGVPPFLRLDLGGATDLRGHPPDVYVGDNRWSGWVEERVPLFPRMEFPLPPPVSATADVTIDGAVFIDAGAAWNRGDWSDGRVHGHWGAGAGLRLTLPFVSLLSLDLATDGNRVRADALAGLRF